MQRARIAILSILIGYSGLTGCSESGAASERESGNATDADRLGGLGLALMVNGVGTIDRINYAITGNGFEKTGELDVSGSGATFSVFIPDIPAGSGYVVRVRPVVAAPATCEGSATFDVTAGLTTFVNLVIQCSEADETGAALINGTLNICPRVRSTSLTPSTQVVGGRIVLEATGSDRDNLPSPLAYTWTSDRGPVVASGSAAEYVCAQPGPVVFNVQVSDGNCTKQAALSALCTQLDGSDAGAQDSGVVVDSGVVDSGVVDSGVPPITGKINAIAAGNNHTCGVLVSGGVKCWGSDATGQLGNGGGTSSIQATPVNVVGLLRPVTSLAAGLGEGHSCALLDDGAVECWGRNNRGQLGNGSSIDSTGPVQVSGLAGRVVSLAVGQAHSCALLETGAVQCWGWDNMGQLGNGPPLANNTLPQSVVGLTGRATSLAAGVTHTCATIEDGSVQCWGSNSVGQVNGMLTADAPSPIPVTGLAGPARDVSAGALHSCAVLNDNRVQCWGRDEAGQVGNDSPLQEAPVPPSFVVGLNQADPIVRIDSGDRHTCVVLQSGGLKCWGFDASGQIGNANVGDGTTPQDRRVQPSAVDVFGLSSGVVSVGGGTAHTCAILSSGAAKCWGRDDSGQLGNNAASPNLSGDRTTPVDVLDFP